MKKFYFRIIDVIDNYRHELVLPECLEKGRIVKIIDWDDSLIEKNLKNCKR